ncbi:hypothetical protein PVK06_017531 [Gossypium arboreum]|uniref:Uncharacterized protein n=1 Tax=Gossypium arboreum TaxID=29729 RepID=A0ABR0Q443_GOSAR|nr:hypothetical protein PVK06_017531 [Gossypium arboreum]
MSYPFEIGKTFSEIFRKLTLLLPFPLPLPLPLGLQISLVEGEPKPLHEPLPVLNPHLEVSAMKAASFNTLHFPPSSNSFASSFFFVSSSSNAFIESTANGTYLGWNKASEIEIDGGGQAKALGFGEFTDVDCELLYLSDRPEKFIITNIAVPPTAIRPSVPVDRSQMFQ